MSFLVHKKNKRKRRHRKVRAKIFGTNSRPRLAVFKSNRYTYAQIIDDTKGITIAATSSLKEKKGTPAEKAKKVGGMIAKAAKEKKINRVVFDRGGFKYTGNIKAVADAAREGGLKF